MTIETLVAEGDRFEDGRVVLRISVTREGSGAVFDDPSHAVRCYAYGFDPRVHRDPPDHIDCPDLPALVLPEPSPAPSLPLGTLEILARTLEEIPAQQRLDDTAVRLAVEKSFSDTDVRVEVARPEGSTPTSPLGIALAAGKDDCVLGRVAVDQNASVTVWYVPRVLAQPGELGRHAADGALEPGQRPPH
ncbi:conserved hypothetical protein [Frankia sp. Hr75.2]|nr:conserved hypothetical protein [Frankia sp. Hr75.2]